MDQNKIKACIVIPVYNNGKTIHALIRKIKSITDDLLIVDDGSTDENLSETYAGTGIRVIRFPENEGKGKALAAALKGLYQSGFDYMITMDGDGQHDPADIPAFTETIQAHPGALIAGCRDFSVPNVPLKSKTGRKLANFCTYLETGMDVWDSQCGFRAYPVRKLISVRCRSSHYDYETEIMTRAAWEGIPIMNLPVRTYYPPDGERITHFRVIADNLRIMRIHSILLIQLLLRCFKRAGYSVKNKN